MHIRCGELYWNQKSRQFFPYEALGTWYKSRRHAENVMEEIGRKRIPEGFTKKDLRIELGSHVVFWGSFD